MKQQKRKTSGASRVKSNASKKSKAAQPTQAQVPALVAELSPAAPTDVVQPAPLSSPVEYSHPKHVLLLIISILLAAIALTWLFANLFFGKVTIGALTTSGLRAESTLIQVVQTQATDYRLGIAAPDGTVQHFSMADMGITPDAAQTVAQVRRAQRALPHLFVWWRPVQVPLVVTVDTAKLQQFIATHAQLVLTPSQDARLAIDSGTVLVVKEIPGTQYGFVDGPSSITDAVRTWRQVPLYMAKTELEPNVTANSLFELRVRLQVILAQQISFVIGSETIHASPADIGAWLTMTPQGQTQTIGVNAAAVRDYLQRVAQDNSNVPRSQVVSDVNGTVLLPGQNGIRVGDTTAVAQSLTDQVLSAKGAKFTLPITQTAFKTVTAPTSGKWIEVDTTTKRMYAYDQGEVVRSFLISSGAAATPTVTGRFAIYSKYRSQDMSGANADGTNYFQPAVPYVNYFYRDYAIHGNYWRPASYFGSINSSHGCVGVQVTDSSWLYYWAPVGTPVIVHT